MLKWNQKIGKFAIILLIIFINKSNGSLQEEEIRRWANELGFELWTLGKDITKFNEISKNYTQYNTQVEKKEPDILLDEIVKDIERMMDRKMDAIMCIIQKAEEESENFNYNNSKSEYKYYSSKWSPISGSKQPVKLPPSLKKNRFMYLEMTLNNDTHFYNLPVNTNHSSVHVPTNIYDRHREAAVAIQWSEALDEVFRQNYNADPALSWQYFGSSSGIMRHYPAKKWEETRKDLFDCRIRTWFIEAATCTKDVVILVDNSGSMDGMGRHIAALTVYSILDTFSNNDYINVLNYSSSTNYLVSCFEDMLVQATEENINVFKKSVSDLQPSGKTDLEQALIVAFDLLEKYREIRGCNSTERHCNQAIMVVTDGVLRNLSDTILQYNGKDGTQNSVRIFTYLIGKEVTNVEEIMWMACANRGYYAHVQSLEQVTASVLQYINVIARPLVLQGVDHPVSWTHAYVDLTYNDENDDQINEPYRLLTSVAAPAFDTKTNKNNETVMANLLGVAGTDVPIADIEKLTVPYKIGVNGYAFIVSNNGYLLMHPDLRPVFEGKLTENYNSIDLTEVEQFDNLLPPREIAEDLLELRFHLVNGTKGSALNKSIKYHYDNMRRVIRESYDYYFAPLANTPFSIALAIPTKYGNFSLAVRDDISNDIPPRSGYEILDFFKGNNWRIHPKWVYCKYHYLEGHEYKTPEKELLHFLEKMDEPNYHPEKWQKQYQAEPDEENLNEVKCGRKTHGDDDYYCDKKLVQRLIQDAETIYSAFSAPLASISGISDLFERYNVTLRFVATMSGLTRWESFYEIGENEKKFGDIHNRAIDEIWYKSAVIQRQFDTESFVYSIPFDSTGQIGLLITGSYAIFPSDAGHEAPGCVVGFQFAYSNFRSRFTEITTSISNQCPECASCNTTLDCYIIDSSGYIIASGNRITGQFFGEFEGDVMNSMLDKGIFEKTRIYDFQALCMERKDNSSSCSVNALTPLHYLRHIINWILFRLTVFFMEFNIYNAWQPFILYAQEIINNENETFVEDDEIKSMNGDGELDDDEDDDDDEEEEDDEDEEEEEDIYYACEKQRDLFVLQQKLLSHDSYPIEIPASDVSRQYYIKQIPYSNLLLVAINSTQQLINRIKYTASPVDVDYGDNETVYPCQKLGLNSLFRRPLTGCYNEHPKEREITACGGSEDLNFNLSLFLLLFCYLLY